MRGISVNGLAVPPCHNNIPWKW